MRTKLIGVFLILLAALLLLQGYFVKWDISRHTNGYRIYQRTTEKMSDWLQHIINQLEHVWKIFLGKRKTADRGKEEWQIRKK